MSKQYGLGMPMVPRGRPVLPWNYSATDKKHYNESEYGREVHRAQGRKNAPILMGIVEEARRIRATKPSMSWKEAISLASARYRRRTSR
jgi:hypothetical protein